MCRLHEWFSNALFGAGYVASTGDTVKGTAYAVYHGLEEGG